MTTRRRRTISDEARDEDNLYNLNYSNKPYVSETYVDNSDMTCRDRTHEFLSAVKSFQSRQGNGVAKFSQNNKLLLQRSEFTQIAKKIGHDISNTFAKLEKLTILAKRKSLFDDKPIEIQELTYIIKQDINNLNKQIAQLQQLVKLRAHKNGRHMQSHSSQVVVSLQSKLASMSNNFKEVLELRTRNLKEQKTRRDQFSQGPVAASMPPSATKGNTGSVLLQDEKTSYGGLGGDVSINMEDMDKQRYQQQLQLIDEQDSYIQSRASTMENIEATIVELGSIFQQLAHMVKEQEEQVQRIDQQIDDTHGNIEAAHGELLKYFQSVTSNRWLMIKIFVVLLVFFIVFIVFMA
ncbi:syntaxin-5-like [Saccoglossus kowalevskii]|uniref:Syntaxin-5-like n=1 Tax=Saccoglossus kowalevskii TaxID=10224 RepID=A0ABM0GMS6_SACKO|nr:PREDICTED: syntaxin-5-like [Saccoglossus kowalevskii]